MASEPSLAAENLQSPQDASRETTETTRRGDETGPKSRTALEEATAFLLAVLATGPRPTTQVRAEAVARGISWATLRRGMPIAGVQKRKLGFQGRWILEIRSLSQTCSSEGAHDSLVSAFAPTREASRDISLPADGSSCHEPSNGQVPASFTIPPGVDCLRWDLRTAPLKIRRGITVFDAEDFAGKHLQLLAARLRGETGWLYDQWPVATLLADLNDVGVELRIPGHKEEEKS